MSEINLLTFCKTYPGAFNAVFPNGAAGEIMGAYHDGILNKHGVNIVLDKFLSQIAAVGIIDGKARVFWKKS